MFTQEEVKEAGILLKEVAQSKTEEDFKISFAIDYLLKNDDLETLIYLTQDDTDIEAVFYTGVTTCYDNDAIILFINKYKSQYQTQIGNWIKSNNPLKPKQ